jgi:hypothetical protein
MVNFHLELVFGSTTSISGSVSFSAPLTQAAYAAINAPIGLVRLFVTGTGYTGICLATNTTTFLIAVNNSSTTYLTNSGLSSTVPATWATGDAIEVNGTYFV